MSHDWDAELARLEDAANDVREEFFVICQTCKVRYAFFISKNDYWAWHEGKFAQDAFPYLTIAERELLISQTCNDCFDQMFPAEE